MHTALMEASMDGHVEVAKLLLESGAQVSKVIDSVIEEIIAVLFRQEVKSRVIIVGQYACG